MADDTFSPIADRIYRLLVVEDNLTLRQHLEDLLGSDIVQEKIGHSIEIESAADVREAQRLIRKGFDVVLLDLRIPVEEGAPPKKEHGLKLLQDIKRVTPTTELITMSGYGTEDDIIDAIDSGAFYYIAKPFRYEMLAALLSRVLEKKESERMARLDAFTGLYNKAYFDMMLENEISKFPRTGEPSRRKIHPLSVIAMDFDHLKEYNDRYGHLEGDRMLKFVASVLSRTTRRTDVVGRCGGDEFGVLLENATHMQALKRAEKIRETIYEEGKTIGPSDLPVSVSIGVATYPSFLKDPRDLYKAADDALYASKRAGRNITCGYTTRGEIKMYQEIIEEMEREHGEDKR